MEQNVQYLTPSSDGEAVQESSDLSELQGASQDVKGFFKKRKFFRCPGLLLIFVALLFLVLFVGSTVFSWILYGNPFYRWGAEMGIKRSFAVVEELFSMKDYDAEDIAKLLPKFMPKKVLKEEYGNDWKKEVAESLEDAEFDEKLEEYFDKLEDSSEIDEVVDVFKTFEFDASYIDVIDSDAVVYEKFEDTYKIEADVIADVVFNVSGEYKNETVTTSITMKMCAVDGKWYICPIGNGEVDQYVSFLR